MADRARRNAASATLPMGFVLKRSLDNVKPVGSQLATMHVFWRRNINALAARRGVSIARHQSNPESPAGHAEALGKNVGGPDAVARQWRTVDGAGSNRRGAARAAVAPARHAVACSEPAVAERGAHAAAVRGVRSV